MTEKNGKLILLLGIGVVFLSLVVLTFDYLIGGFALLIGLWNVFKGSRMMRGKKPILIRMKEKRDQEERDLDPFNPEHREKYNSKDD